MSTITDEAARAALEELVARYRMLTEKGPLDEFDRGVRGARLQFIDDLTDLLSTSSNAAALE